MFRARGVPVHDADATVHRLYAGEAAPMVEAAFPGVVRDGVVDRAELAARVVGRPDAMARLETIIHPLVRGVEEAFLATARGAGARIVVLDIPLLW
jgi:dephospho-CoA kinase